MLLKIVMPGKVIRACEEVSFLASIKSNNKIILVPRAFGMSHYLVDYIYEKFRGSCIFSSPSYHQGNLIPSRFRMKYGYDGPQYVNIHTLANTVNYYERPIVLDNWSWIKAEQQVIFERAGFDLAGTTFSLY